MCLWNAKDNSNLDFGALHGNIVKSVACSKIVKSVACVLIPRPAQSLLLLFQPPTLHHLYFCLNHPYFGDSRSRICIGEVNIGVIKSDTHKISGIWPNVLRLGNNHMYIYVDLNALHLCVVFYASMHEAIQDCNENIEITTVIYIINTSNHSKGHTLSIIDYKQQTNLWKVCNEGSYCTHLI